MRASLGRVPPLPSATDDSHIDSFIEALAEPDEERPPLLDRLVGLVHLLAGTPRRAGLCLVWVLALALALAALVPRAVTVHTRLGPAGAHCWIDSFTYPDGSAASTCRHAETGRLLLLLPAVLVIAAGIVAAARLAAPSARPGGDRTGPTLIDRIRQSRIETTLLVVAVLAIPLGAMALRPALAQLHGPSGITTVHCGADTYFLGYPDPDISRGCHLAYRGQAHVLVATSVVILIGLGVLGRPRGPAAGWRRALCRLLFTTLGLLLFVVGLAALRPVDAPLPGPGQVTARCGVDTFLVGHPDRAVAAVCRSRLRIRGPAGMATVALSLVAFAAGCVVPRRFDLARPPDTSAGIT